VQHFIIVTHVGWSGLWGVLQVRRRDFLGLIGGATTLRPLAGAAQQQERPVIGFLSVGSPGPSARSVTAFRQGLSDTGYVESQNVVIEYRWVGGHLHKLAPMAADLVDRKVDAMVTTGGPEAAFAAKKVTTTIPIVFSVGVDPVEIGLVQSLAQPGGNLTGIMAPYGALFPKQVEVLLELVPSTQLIALLTHSHNPAVAASLRQSQEAANTRGLEFQRLTAGTEAEINAALESLDQEKGRALLVAGDPLFDVHHEQIVALTIRHAIPAIFHNSSYAKAGGLLSYGLPMGWASRQTGVYVGRILAGTKPADLPVQQPTKFELVINLKTAKLLSLTVPQTILARADEVVE
jgi:putative ABC transport system substrate-binding protein